MSIDVWFDGRVSKYSYIYRHIKIIYFFIHSLIHSSINSSIYLFIDSCTYLNLWGNLVNFKWLLFACEKTINETKL